MVTLLNEYSDLRNNLLLFVVDSLKELVLVGLWKNDLAVLLNGLLQLSVHLLLGGQVLGAVVSVLMEDAALVLVHIIKPQRSGLTHEVFLKLNVPVFVFTIELHVFLGVHAVDIDDSIISLG